MERREENKDENTRPTQVSVNQCSPHTHDDNEGWANNTDLWEDSWKGGTHKATKDQSFEKNVGTALKTDTIKTVSSYL